MKWFYLQLIKRRDCAYSTMNRLIQYYRILSLSILSGWTIAQVNANDLLTAVTKTKDMIITSSLDATKAGEAVLRSGGSAVDAMIAAQAVLGLVRPQDSGLGGGAFVVYYDADTDTTTTFDGRETAPAAATEDRFEGMDWLNAWQSGLSVGAPGVPRLMEVMHQRYGKITWADLFEDAIDLAETGFKFHQTVPMYITMLYDMFGFECSGDGVLFFRDLTAKKYFLSENCTAPVSMIYLVYVITMCSNRKLLVLVEVSRSSSIQPRVRKYFALNRKRRGRRFL